MSKADGSMTFAVNVDNRKAVNELNKLEQKIVELENEHKRLGSERDAQVQAARQQEIILDQELARLREMQAAPKWTYEKADIAEQAERVRALRAEYNAIERSVERINNAMGATDRKLDKAKTRAGELTEEITISQSAAVRLKEAAAEAGKRMERFSNRVKGLAKRVFVFSLITSALRAMKTWFGKVIKSNKEASAALAKLKGALLTLIQPLVNVIIPAFVEFINVLTRIVNTVAALVSQMFGTTAEESAKAAEALYNEAEALEGTGDAAKKAGKDLAGFDEINQIGNKDESETGKGTTAPDFTGAIGEGLSGVASLFTGMALVALGAVLTFTGANILTGLAAMAAGAAMVYGAVTADTGLAASLTESGLDVLMGKIGLALLGIGAVLTFTGVALGLGIALMVSGALMMATPIALNWGVITTLIEEHVNEIMLFLAGALLVIGAIIAFTGNLPLGIGLMIAGIMVSVAVAALNWDVLGAELEEHINEIFGVVAAASLVLGAIFAFTGNLPLGIGLLALGAAGLVALVVINEDAINEALQGPIGVITALVSGALLVLGGILLFTGANIPLGLGLLLAGVVGLAKVATVNWDSIVEALQGPIGLVSVLVGTALLVLGVILLFTGAGIPIGLGLILAGVVGLAAPVAANWDFLLEKIKGAWEAVKGFWNEHIAPVFTAKWWGDLAKKAINGFLSILESGINEALSGAASLVNGIIGLINKIPGIDIAPVNWGNVKLPRLATGAVIPPNREFLAVLGDQKSGTNIEAPLETIVQAFRQALAEQGGGSNGRPIYLMLDRRELGRAVVEVGDQERTRVGISLT